MFIDFRYYSVVGILEDMDASLAVFEGFIPQYFRGAREKKERKKNTNKVRPHISEKAKQILRDTLKDEIIFYEYCKQRLYRQYKALMM